MSHLKYSASTGHLLHNSDGHLIHECALCDCPERFLVTLTADDPNYMAYDCGPILRDPRGVYVMDYSLGIEEGLYRCRHADRGVVLTASDGTGRFDIAVSIRDSDCKVNLTARVYGDGGSYEAYHPLGESGILGTFSDWEGTIEWTDSHWYDECNPNNWALRNITIPTWVMTIEAYES